MMMLLLLLLCCVIGLTLDWANCCASMCRQNDRGVVDTCEVDKPCGRFSFENRFYDSDHFSDPITAEEAECAQVARHCMLTTLTLDQWGYALTPDVTAALELVFEFIAQDQDTPSFTLLGNGEDEEDEEIENVDANKEKLFAVKKRRLRVRARSAPSSPLLGVRLWAVGPVRRRH